MFRPLYLRKSSLFLGIAVVLLLAGFFVFQGPLNAQARTESHTLFVGQTAGNNTGCSSPGFTSVQAAVDAAHARDTVYLCGVFKEQVIISKTITLTGDSGAALDAPASFPAPATLLPRLPAQFTTDSLFVPSAIVIIWGTGAHVTMHDLTVAGVIPTNGGCANSEFGVLVIGGATVTLKDDSVKDIRDSDPTLYGCQYGVGIQVGRRYWPTADFSQFLVENFVGHATIEETTASGYQKDGITIDGPGSTADVEHNWVNGSNRDSQLSPIIAQNGIEVLRGAYGHVHGNIVTGNTYTGTAGASASGIVVYGGCGDPVVKNVEVDGNLLINNDVGIYLNNFSPATDCSAPATTRTNDEAKNNVIRNNAVTNQGVNVLNSQTYNGYQAGIDDIGNHDSITSNEISGAGYVPAQTTPPGPFVEPIDTTSFPTIHPIVHDNDID